MGENLHHTENSDSKLSAVSRVLKPISIENLTTQELYAEIEKGFDDFKNGRYHNFDDVVAELEKEML